MAQIRATIKLLTNILKENGCTEIKAEIFRLGKFNQVTAVAPLWRLLFELVYFCEYSHIDEVCTRAYNRFSTEELVVYVKREMQKKGFYSLDFALLPNDMSAGSREILLALGWLMCKENLVTRFMLNCTSPLEDDTEYLYQAEEDEETKCSKTAFPLAPSAEDANTRVQQLLWLNNKLQLSLRSLDAMHREKNTLRHKVHEATQGVSPVPERNHLSMLEVYMLRHPELLTKNMELLEIDNERLQNLLSWKDHEDVFWKWMESVLDAKLQQRAASASSPGGAGEPAGDGSGCGVETMDSVLQDSLRTLSDSRLGLREAIIKYEAIVDHLERLWTNKSSEVSESELDSVLSSIDLELNVQRASISIGNCEQYLHNHTRLKHQQQQGAAPAKPSFVYEKKPCNKPPGRPPPPRRAASLSTGASPSSASAGSANLHTIKDIEQEISKLQGTVSHLQGEVECKQNSFKDELQVLSSKFKDAICIPPMGRKF